MTAPALKRWRSELPRLRFLRKSARISSSQEGEDLVLARLFEATKHGIYVDVGAHHPFRFSNTCLLHRKGWKGINIDALPGSMEPFRKVRPTDVCLECGVSERSGSMTYFMFKDPALNTFDVELAAERSASGWPSAGQKEVLCEPLSTILFRELPHLNADRIDLMTIGVEGFDLQVIRSKDWSRFRPKALVVETLDEDPDSLRHSEIHRYCSELGYRALSKLFHSVIYVDHTR